MIEQLNDLLNFVKTFCGDICSDVLKVMIKESSEFLDEELASEVNAGINEVRRALYDLQSLGIVTYHRERDEKDGKFIYYWYADIEHLNQLLLQRKRSVLKRLEERLKLEEENSFYICPHDEIRLSFDEALENDFKCPRCSASLEFIDNYDIKRRLKELILCLQEEVSNEERSFTR
ncbi:MAG: transcription factor [Sulfolobales archaeon]|nr:transcription factor [Sulfolobales archaeon]MCX8186291.1 transcription factor [Sulfolobales archaeon]MDW7968973.1 transcription factor [Sulfolobales archaeon]